MASVPIAALMLSFNNSFEMKEKQGEISNGYELQILKSESIHYFNYF